MEDISIKNKLLSIGEQKEKLVLEERVLIEKGLNSGNVEEIYASQKYLQNIQKRTDESTVKSVLIDPYHLNSSFGYRDKNYAINYQTLRLMSKVHIINSIIKTRISQVTTFCQPQPDKYSTGFVIKKKSQNRFGIDKEGSSNVDQNKINYITDFILNCGRENNSFIHDDFVSFTAKFINDSLSLDQATAEITRDRKGQLVEFFATDGATFKLTDEHQIYDDMMINGHKPSSVQVIDGRIFNHFYPWELIFGVRNQSTSIFKAGYGESELEILIKTVTSILNSDHYNANFFRVGSNPRGMFRYSGNINPNTLHDFRQQWHATMAGVNNMHKVPFINADKLDWVQTHETNKDMEFGKYYEFLIKVSCAVYTIDPSEIGFSMSGSMESKPMFEGNNEGRLKYSKDKGLRPLLKWYERILNKYIVSQLDEDYILEFVGIDEISEQNELDRDIKEASNISTVNEIREKRGMKKVKGGDIILNSFFLQSQQMEMYGGQDSNSQVDEDSGKPTNDLDNPFDDYSEKSENPFEKSLNQYFNNL